MKYLDPKTTNELEHYLSIYQDYYILNGGSDILVQHNEKSLDSNYPIIDISKISSLNNILEDENNIYIGAIVKYSDIYSNMKVKHHFPSLVEMASEIGSAQIRNIGTLTGNLAISSPGGDSPVVLENLDAYLIIKNNTDTKKIIINDFITGFRTNTLEKGSYISTVVIPKKKQYSFFKKYGLSHKQKVVIANASIALSFNIKNGLLCDVKTTIGACSTKFINNNVLDEYLNNKSLSSLEYDTWMKLVDEQLKEMTNKYFYEMKMGHLKGCADDAFNYIIRKLEEA